MEVNIDELVSNVHAVDGDTLLTPQVMRRIVQAVMTAMEQQQLHQQRTAAEQRVTSGVVNELEQD